MAYQILCDGFPIFDPRDDELIVQNPKCTLEVNKVGEASFSIFADHPHYSKMQKMRSIFEILQDREVIFRGRMPEDTNDFVNTKEVDIEGVLAFFNDSVIRPFSFPEDFLEDAGYITAANSGNVIEFFLSWVINQHNSQVEDFQKFKLGNVTVTDPNNYLSRSNEDYSKSLDTLKDKLFESALGGYLCIRYEADGNYIDYLADFTETNAQRIVYGENLLDLTSNSSAAETYTAVIPLGKKKSEINEDSEDDSRLTIEELGDGDITSDIVKRGDTLYSKSAVAKYGWIYAPTSETTFDDVSIAANLQSRGVEFLEKKGILLSNTLTFKAVDLHFSDKEIESFRIYKKVEVESAPHGQEDSYNLPKLALDLQNPQNTEITIGDTQLSMTDINARNKSNAEKELQKVAATSIKKIVTEYAISTNAATHYDGWSTTAPAWSTGMYMWTRQKITYADGTVQYTEPVCDGTWQAVNKADEKFVSEIKQLQDSITLGVTGSLGSKAEIVLSVGGTEKKTELELSKVREAFAKDNTSIAISAGLITFNSGTIVINSNNFKVSSAGVIEATSGTIGAITLSTTGIYSNNSNYSASYAGWYKPLTISTSSNCFFAGATDATGTAAKFRVTYGGALKCSDVDLSGVIITESGYFKTMLSSGGLRMYYDGNLCGKLSSTYYGSKEDDQGMCLSIEDGGKFLMFTHPDDSQSSGRRVDYILNCGWSSNYNEMHLFQTSARFLSDVYFDGKTDIGSLRLRGAGGKRYLITANDNGTVTCSVV